MLIDMDVSTLIGKTLIAIDSAEHEEIIFTTDTGEVYKLYHDQDCCESVTVDDICGDLLDLLGSPIIEAEEVTSNINPDDVTDEFKKNQDDSFTWTFYKFGTAKGFVTIRWYGQSNGYYSESVDFCRIK